MSSDQRHYEMLHGTTSQILRMMLQSSETKKKLVGIN